MVNKKKRVYLTLDSETSKYLKRIAKVFNVSRNKLLNGIVKGFIEDRRMTED